VVEERNSPEPSLGCRRTAAELPTRFCQLGAFSQTARLPFQRALFFSLPPFEPRTSLKTFDDFSPSPPQTPACSFLVFVTCSRTTFQHGLLSSSPSISRRWRPFSFLFCLMFVIFPLRSSVSSRRPSRAPSFFLRCTHRLTPGAVQFLALPICQSRGSDPLLHSASGGFFHAFFDSWT